MKLQNYILRFCFLVSLFLAIEVAWSQNISQGLVTYYPFNGNANDGSGNGYNGTVSGSVLTTDRFGNPNQAYEFDGVDDYITIPGTGSLHLTTGFSLACWANFTDEADGFLVGKHVWSVFTGYFIAVTNQQFVGYVNSDTRLYPGDNITYNDGNWHFVVSTYDGSVLRLYVDAIYKNSQTRAYTNTNTADITIGGLPGPHGNFKGKIDEVRIYNRPLTVSEIQELYSGQPPQAGLAAFWPLDEQSGTLVADASGHGLAGTASGATIIDGVKGKARSFNGVNNYIEVPDNDFLDINTQITLMMWAKIDPTATEGFLISKRIQNDVNCDINYDIKYGGSPGGVYLAFQFGSGCATGSNYALANVPNLNDNEWHHLAVSFVFGQPSSALWMIDGAGQPGTWSHWNGSSGGGDQIPNTNSYNLEIGRQLSASPGYHKGAVDQIRIFNRALSENEIRDIYNAEKEQQNLPELAVSDKSHDFGEARIGTTQDWTLLVSNTGNATLTITSILSDNTVFTVTSPSFPSSIPPGGNLTVNVQFKPVEQISYSGNLSINSNDPDQPVFRAAVSGIGQLLDGIGGIVYDPSSPLFDPNDLAKSGIPDAEVKIYVCSAIDYIYNGDLPTVRTDHSGRYRIDLSNCGITSERFLTIEVHSNNYNPTRIPDIYQLQTKFITLNIALSSNQLELAKPYKTTEGHFSISYETAGPDECFESNMMTAFQIQENGLSVFKKAPTMIFELGRSLEYALKKFVEFCFLQIDEGQYPITVKVEDVPVFFGLQPSAHGKFSPGQAGAIYINATEGHRTELPATAATQFYYWLGTDAAHELFHHVQWIRMGRPICDDITFPLLKPRSVIEGTAVWVENLVFPPHRPSVATPSYLTWTSQVFESPYQHSGLASDLSGSEPYQGPPAFWTFLSEQTGEVVNFKDLFDCSRIAFGPSIIKDLLYSGADLSALDKVIQERWKGNETRYTLYYRWQLANILKDYSFQTSDGPDTLKVLYRQYRTASGISIYRHFYYPALIIPDNWKCNANLNSYYYLGETSPLRDLYNECAAYFQISPQSDVKAIALQPFYESNIDLDNNKDIMPCDVAVFCINTVGQIISSSQDIKHFSLPQGTDKLIVMLSNTSTIAGKYNNVGLGIFAHDGTKIPHFEIGVLCPVQLQVTLPSGFQVSSGSPSPPNTFFINDILQSGRSIKGISFLGPEDGLYRITLLPDSTSSPSDSFSLYALLGNDTTWLAKDVQIGEISNEGYAFCTLPSASVRGRVREGSTFGLAGVTLDVYDSAGSLWGSLVTDDTGYYHVDNIPNGKYSIAVVTPLGYQTDQETKEFTINHVPVTVNFSLTKLGITPRPRSRAYWADQLTRALQNKPQDYTLKDFSRFTGLINVHFNHNQINPVDFYSVPQPASQSDSLMVLKKLLLMCTGEKEPFFKRLGKSDLMALMLNVVSGKISQTQTISADGRTVSQAITYCDMLVNDEIDCPNTIPGHGIQGCRYVLADLILTLVNFGLKVPKDLIPADVIQIAYKIHNKETLPTGFALEQNYPNPFNPKTQIDYALPKDCNVKVMIYNILGQKVMILVDEFQIAGFKTVVWDGKDDQGQKCGSGIYFYKIQAGEFTQAKKMVIVK